METTSYPPAQQRIIDLLGRRDDEVRVEPEVIVRLRAELEGRVEDAAAHVPSGSSLWVGKSALHLLDGCEAQWQAVSLQRFAWTVASATGTVAHKAIELALNWRGASAPARLVDEAVTTIVDGDDGLAAFARGLSTVELAELRRDAVAFVTAFEECFPPLRPQWRPVIEGPVRVPLAAGRIVLSGRPDLTLGRAAEGGKVIIDLKTGRPQRRHVDDLRFYALLDACKLGVAPRRVATVHLDSGEPVVEAVTEGMLEAAVERVVHGVTAMAEIRARRRPAVVRPGPSCAWCPIRDDCEAGTAFLTARADGQLDESFWWST